MPNSISMYFRGFAPVRKKINKIEVDENCETIKNVLKQIVKLVNITKLEK